MELQNQNIRLLVNLIVLFFCLRTPAQSDSNQSGASNTPRPTVSIGLTSIPILTDEEIDHAPIADLRNSAMKYAEYFFDGTDFQYARSLNLKHAFSEDMRKKYLHVYEVMSELEVRNRTKIFFKPGGVEKVNNMFYDELKPFLDQWDSGVVKGFGIQPSNPVLHQPRPDLSPEGIRESAALGRAPTPVPVAHPNAPDSWGGTGLEKKKYIIIGLGIILLVCGFVATKFV